MFLILGVVFAFATVPLSGGRWWYLDHESLNGKLLLLSSVGGQFLLGVLADGSAARTLHVASYLVLAMFIWSNRSMVGFGLFGLGTACNFAAIVANGGVMPVSPDAWEASGVTLETDRFLNARPIDDARLAAFGDAVPMPSQIPGATAFSVGDLILVMGLTAIVHGICRSRLIRDPAVARRLAGIEADADKLARDRERWFTVLRSKGARP